MQLQKLAYLAHGWALAVTGEPLLDDDFEAWEFGPVNRRLYDALKKYGSSPIPKYIRWGDDAPYPEDYERRAAFEDLTDDEDRVISKVWENYGSFPAFQLSALTHEPGTPWTRVYEEDRNRMIPNEEIREYFIKLADPVQ